MILELAMLGLAVASDSESDGNEQEWTRRFEEVDKLRVQYGVPPLTAQDRIRWMIGQQPSKEYVLVWRFDRFHERQTLDDVILSFYRKEVEEPASYRRMVFSFLPSWKLYEFARIAKQTSLKIEDQIRSYAEVLENQMFLRRAISDVGAGLIDVHPPNEVLGIILHGEKKG
jgi:hypothetical protein